MKCLSIHQPWAWAILDPVLRKNIENRTWPTNHRGPLLIHAAKSRKSYDAWPAAEWYDAFESVKPAWEDLPQGAIVGVVDLIDCVRVQPGLDYWLPGVGPNPWAEGPVLWVLDNPRRFDKPIPYKGQQNLFDVPDAVVQAAMTPSAVA